MIKTLPKQMRIALAGLVLMGLAIYALLLFTGNGEKSLYLQERGIDSLPKLLLNGFLGQFF